MKIQKRDMETKDIKAQGSATLKDAAFAIISLNENPVLVEGKLYKKNEGSAVLWISCMKHETRSKLSAAFLQRTLIAAF